MVKERIFARSPAPTDAGREEEGKGGLKSDAWGFPGGTVVESLPANAGDTGSSPGLGRSHMPRGN